MLSHALREVCAQAVQNSGAQTAVKSAETATDDLTPGHGMAAPAVQRSDAAELSAALTRLCDTVTTRGGLPPRSGSAEENVLSVAWNGLTELTRIWGSLVSSLSHVGSGAQPHAAHDPAAGHGAGQSEERATSGSAQRSEPFVLESAAMRQASLGALAAVPADLAGGWVRQPQDAVEGPPQLPHTAAHVQAASRFSHAGQAPYAPALRLLRARAATPPPDTSCRNSLRDAAAPSAVPRKRHGQCASAMNAVDEVIGNHAGVSFHGSEDPPVLLGSVAEADLSEHAPTAGLARGDDSASHPPDCRSAALQPSAASPASSDSGEGTVDSCNDSASASLDEPQSPLSDVSAAEARPLAQLTAQDPANASKTGQYAYEKFYGG